MIWPEHIGIIMDGNGRWAQSRGLPRWAGHQAGVQTVRRITHACVDYHINVLTLYAFSTENWNRPKEEVAFLMGLVEEYARSELPELQQNGIRLQWMGKRNGLPGPVLQSLDQAIEQTQNNSCLTVNLAFNYGGREELVDAAKAILAAYQKDHLHEENPDESMVTHYLYCPNCPDVDLVIRTSGERRLSNFLLWRTARSVFLSTPVLWPDFQPGHLKELLDEYVRQALKDEPCDEYRS